MAEEAKSSSKDEPKRPDVGDILPGDKLALAGYVVAALTIIALLIYLMTAGPQ